MLNTTTCLNPRTAFRAFEEEAVGDVTRAVGRPALRVLGPGEAEREALLEEWVLRQRAGGLTAKTIRERLAVV